MKLDRAAVELAVIVLDKRERQKTRSWPADGYDQLMSAVPQELDLDAVAQRLEQKVAALRRTGAGL